MNYSIWIAILLFSPFCSAAPSSTTVGGLLDGLKKKVLDATNEIIQNAVDGLTEVSISAFQEINFAIDNAKTAFQEMENKLIQDLTNEQAQIFQNLDALVEKILKREADILENLSADVQQFCNSLPFANLRPQVTRVDPDVIVPTNTFVEISFYGNFFYSSDPSFTTVLILNGQTIWPTEIHTTLLIFRIPSSMQNGTRFSLLQGQLVVGWLDKGWIWNEKKNSSFVMGLPVLPLTPGNITLQTTLSTDRRVVQHHVSESTQAWGDSCYPQNYCFKFYYFRPTTGWKIVTSSVQFVIHSGAHGNHEEWIDSNTEDQVVIKCKLTAYDGKHMGRIDFHVEFNEQTTVTDKIPNNLNVYLSWYNSQVLTLQPNEIFTKVSIDTYDGKHLELMSPADSNKYIQLQTFGDPRVKISANPSRSRSRFFATKSAGENLVVISGESPSSNGTIIIAIVCSIIGVLALVGALVFFLKYRSSPKRLGYENLEMSTNLQSK